jgi:hypothetical protein
MSRQTRGGNITIREGTGEKYWYTQFGYILASVLGILYILITADNISNPGTGIIIAIVALGLAVYGLVTYGALFRDNAYIRGQYHGWTPRWWYYWGAGFGIPVGIYLIGRIAGSADAGLGLALLAFVLSTLGMNVAWIYNRHRFIGIP